MIMSDGTIVQLYNVQLCEFIGKPAAGAKSTPAISLILSPHKKNNVNCESGIYICSGQYFLEK